MECGITPRVLGINGCGIFRGQWRDFVLEFCYSKAKFNFFEDWRIEGSPLRDVKVILLVY